MIKREIVDVESDKRLIGFGKLDSSVVLNTNSVQDSVEDIRL